MSIPFPPRGPSNIPILGQPLEIKGMFVQVIAHCNCTQEDRTILFLNQGSTVRCEQCKMLFQLVGLNPDGTLNIMTKSAQDKGPIQ